MFLINFIGLNFPILCTAFFLNYMPNCLTTDQTPWRIYNPVPKINTKLQFNYPICYIQFICVSHWKCLQSTGNGRLLAETCSHGIRRLLRKKTIWYRTCQHKRCVNKISEFRSHVYTVETITVPLTNFKMIPTWRADKSSDIWSLCLQKKRGVKNCLL
jgi:hypothetical protein